LKEETLSPKRERHAANCFSEKKGLPPVRKTRLWRKGFFGGEEELKKVQEPRWSEEKGYGADREKRGKAGGLPLKNVLPRSMAQGLVGRKKKGEAC